MGTFGAIILWSKRRKFPQEKEVVPVPLGAGSFDNISFFVGSLEVYLGDYPSQTGIILG